MQGDGYVLLSGGEGFEDGTLNYLNLPAVEIGLKHLAAIGMETIAEDIGDMVLHRLRAQHQVPGNRSVTLTLGDQVENLAFTLGEVRKGYGRCRLREGGEVMNQMLRNRRAEDGFAPVLAPWSIR